LLAAEAPTALARDGKVMGVWSSRRSSASRWAAVVLASWYSYLLMAATVIGSRVWLAPPPRRRLWERERAAAARRGEQRLIRSCLPEDDPQR